MSSSTPNKREDDFRRMYAKAIADALHAKEEEEKNEFGKRSTRDDSKSFERAKRAYSELCHDDPIISGGDEDCRCLARSLAPRQFGSRNEGDKLGLCCRLVDGLLQAVARAESQMASAAPRPQSEENDAKESNTDSFGSGPSSSREGYAELAFTMFIEGPYRCVQQADNLSTASLFLGSFEPPKATVESNQLTSEEKSRLIDEATASIVDGMDKISMEEERKVTDPRTDEDSNSSSSSDFFHNNKHNQMSRHNKDESMEEIFAEESDPDDYDFGPDVSCALNMGATICPDDDFSSGFDPITLSKPTTINASWDGARKAICYLMSNMSYGKLLLSCLSTRTWLDMKASDTLADFAFMLLLHHTQEGEATNKNSLLISSSIQNDGTDDSDISALWDRPLFILRDRALDSNRDHDALVAYLQLLQAFLIHSENDIMSILSSPSSKQASVLPPITLVGLSGLATLCLSKELTCMSASKMKSSSVLSICPREEVKKAVLSSLYSLAHVLECVRPRKLTSDEEILECERLWIRTASCIFPIIEYLTNLRARFDFQPVFEGSGNKNLAFTEADAKCILESGVLRELLALSAAAAKYPSTPADSDKVSDASNVTRSQLLRTIYSLCISSPDVLGKFAVRVPDLAKEVLSSQFMDNSLLDGILWTSLSASMLESKSAVPASRLKLRAGVKLKNSDPVDDSSMADRNCSGFLGLCNAAQLALNALKESVTEAIETAEHDTSKEAEKHKKSLADIICFANCLANCSNATKVWMSSLNSKQDGAQQAKEKITELRSVLANIPSYSDDNQSQRVGHKKNDDDADTEQDHYEIDVVKQKETNSTQKRKEFGRIVASVRASVKIIASALESQKGRGLSLKGDLLCNISSKTD